MFQFIRWRTPDFAPAPVVVPDTGDRSVVQTAARQIQGLATAISTLFREALDIANATKSAKVMVHA